MTLKLYNTLTGQKEDFVPIKKNQVGMYVCGPTVYNYFHIGNARPFMIFEVLRRYLQFRNYHVTYVSNFTDIDDKVINKANELGLKYSEVAERYINEYYKDSDCLNIGRADIYPRATDHISDIVEFIKGLEKKGYTYVAGGDVFFDVNKFQDYGKLSKQNLDEIRSGIRVDLDIRKKNPYDFVLWKKAKDKEPSWESPWSKGRPGWHIECSVMSTKYLGESFDIHAGGADLIFPHHENEIAQSEALSGKLFAKYWLHNGYLKIENQKMSKSLCNILTIRDLCEKYNGSVIRYFLLSAHYRSPLNYSSEQMEQSKKSMENLNNLLYNIKFLFKQNQFIENVDDESKELLDFKEKMEDKYIKAMDDDFNTPVALSTLFLLAKQTNIYLGREKKKNKKVLQEVLSYYEKYGSKILGLHFFSEINHDDYIEQELDIEALIKKREDARNKRDWDKADSIRKKLKEMGVVIEDTPTGVRWKRS